MKEGWEYKTLGSITTMMADGPFGSNLKKDHYTNDRQVRIIQLSNIGEDGWREDNKKYTTFSHLETIKRSQVEAGDLVIAKMMPAGRAIICPSNEPAYVLSSDAVKAVLKKDGILNTFILYQINSPYFRRQVYENVSGSGRVRTSLTKLRDCILQVPPLSEQQSIVDYLDSAFAKIDAMKANAEKALNEAKALFQASLKEMLEPKEGWEEKTLKEICRVINGRAYSKDEMLKQGKYRLLRVGNFFTNDSWFYSDLELEEDKYCDNGDLLYAWSASFGPRIWDGEKVIYHYHIWKMVCSEKIDKYFMYYWLDSDELKKQTMTNLHGATMAHITKGIIEAAFVRFPSLSVQQAIVATLDSLKSKVDRLQENFDKISQECDALKQALLRQVFE